MSDCALMLAKIFVVVSLPSICSRRWRQFRWHKLVRHNSLLDRTSIRATREERPSQHRDIWEADGGSGTQGGHGEETVGTHSLDEAVLDEAEC